MRIFLSEEGPRAWEAIKKSPQQAAAVFDLDGTVWTVVQFPNSPEVHKHFPIAFRALAAQMGAVGYLTGRSVEQVRNFGLAIPDVHIIGQFGAEYGSNGDRHLWVPEPPKLVEARTRLHQVLMEARLKVLTSEEMNAGKKGVTVEDVKSHMLAVHYTPGLPKADVARLVESLEGLALDTDLAPSLGHGVVEIGPLGVNKKGALERFLSLVLQWTPSAVLYAGDSKPDLDAFAVLDQLRTEEGGRVPTLKVCASNDPELMAQADLVVDGPMGTLALVKELCEITAPQQRQ